MKWLQKWGENDNLLAKWTDKNMSTLQNSTSISSYCWLYIWRGYLGLHHTCMYHPIKINKLSQFSVSSLIPKKYDAMEISQLEAPPLHWLNKRNVCMTRDVNLDGSSGGCWLYFTLSLLMGKKSPNPKLRIGATSLKKDFTLMFSSWPEMPSGWEWWSSGLLFVARQTLSQFYHRLTRSVSMQMCLAKRIGLFLAIQTSKMWGQEMP